LRSGAEAPGALRVPDDVYTVVTEVKARLVSDVPRLSGIATGVAIRTCHEKIPDRLSPAAACPLTTRWTAMPFTAT